jgi:NarL family two-component system response regulator LiaR
LNKDDMNEETVLRTIVADDDPLLRRLIRDTLQRAEVTVIAEASTGREAVELALFYRPDVAVMDFMMPEMDGIAASRLRGLSGLHA